jgi:hypothetical protein
MYNIFLYFGLLLYYTHYKTHNQDLKKENFCLVVFVVFVDNYVLQAKFGRHIVFAPFLIIIIIIIILISIPLSAQLCPSLFSEMP